ncbi:MAG: MATE family efflux transporter, partial [Candidatus Ornithomonoglobus sp.]
MENDFSKGSVRRHILSQAIPLTIAQLVQILYNITDRMYIGHLPGTSGLALTGIGLIFPIVTLINAFTTLFGQGGGALCSIARGAGKIERAEKIMTNTFELIIGSGVVIMVLCYAFKTPVIYALGASDDTYGYANDYLNIYLLGTVFAMISVGMNWFINSQGFARFGMVTVLCGAVLNILLDPLFIFAFGLGIRGAAIATVISQFVSMLWVLR